MIGSAQVISAAAAPTLLTGMLGVAVVGRSAGKPGFVEHNTIRWSRAYGACGSESGEAAPCHARSHGGWRRGAANLDDECQTTRKART